MSLALLQTRAFLAENGALSVDYTRDNGIDWKKVERFVGIPVIAGLKFLPPRHFEIGGKVASVVIEASDEWGEVVDLVAWPLTRPDKFATMLGMSAVLGSDAIFNPGTYALDGALQVHRTPLEWLQSNCDGCVILDPVRGGRLLFDALGRIAGRDEGHARQIVEMIDATVQLPQVGFASREAA